MSNLKNTHNSTINKQESLSARFLKTASTYPDSNALFIDGKYYTYADLWLIVLGVYSKIPQDKIYNRIGVYCNDDVVTYASLLAINLYGAAYVPLNAKFPQQRLQSIIDHCDLEVVLASYQSTDTSRLITNMIYTDGVELSKNPIPGEVEINTFKKANQNIAYILFTSGSTGKPKGVPVTNGNTNSFFNYFFKNYDFTNQDKFLQVYELTFDVSVFSFFMPLIVGACCYVLPTDSLKFMKTIEYLKKYKITVVSMVPTILNYLDKYFSEINLPNLRLSFFSGDALRHSLATKWSKSIPNAIIHNFYGPTETTIVCTRYVFDETASEKESVNGIVPLGKPFDGMDSLIVDENNLVVDKGELCFSGSQVISSYLNHTNEKCFFTYQNKRYYKTGDIASYNKNGNLLFYGRTDSQVKVNGFRIELTEVEDAISKLIKTKAVVVYVNSKEDINRLIAFYTGEKLDEAKIKTDLSLTIPVYMIPHKIIAVDSFPLNDNGKVAKQSLLNFV